MAQDDGKTFCNDDDDDGINIDVSYAIYFTTGDGAALAYFFRLFESLCIFGNSTWNRAKVLNRLIDRIHANG